MIGEEALYSIAFNDSLSYRRQWNEYPKVLKDKLNFSVLLADKNGKINQIH